MASSRFPRHCAPGLRRGRQGVPKAVFPVGGPHGPRGPARLPLGPLPRACVELAAPPRPPFCCFALFLR